MPRTSTKNKPVKAVAEEEVLEAVAEATEEEVTPEAPAAPAVTKNLGSLGTAKFNTPIVSVGKRTVNGREYNEVCVAGGITYLLSDEDLEKQRIM